MLGVIVNVAVIVVCGLVGLFFNKFFNEHVKEVLMQALGISAIAFGVSDIAGATVGTAGKFNSLLLVLSFVIGGFIGSKLKIEYHIKKASGYFIRKFSKNDDVNLMAEGFVNGTIIFCVGALLIMGCIDAASGNYTKLFLKAALDGATVIVLVAKYGWGAILAVIPVFIVQTVFVLLAELISPYLTPAFYTQLAAIGGAFMILIGLNVAEIKEIHTADMMPAILGALVALWI